MSMKDAAMKDAAMIAAQPGERSITCQLLPTDYPTHAQVALNVSGIVNCGVTVEFLDPTP